MMDSFETVQNEIFRIITDIDGLLTRVKSVHPAVDPVLIHWEKICGRIETQISEQVLRVAIVGAIKSGKSTLVNCLLEGDYLNRGAGVVTSIVTRIRRGGSLKATLFFKSWDDINLELEQAMSFFPVKDWQTEGDSFDLRRRKDRLGLQKALESVSPDTLVKDGSLNAGGLVVSNYLKGFETVKDLIDSDSSRVEFFKGNFEAHKAFVGNDALAVYLRDILLEIDSKILNHNIEIADCQGSDSPNPLHLSMIQDYLISAHLIIYVVSSRTGLREADIRFLSIIKKMGILDNILFVVNCDFSEHETVQDLKRLVRKTEQELSLIKPDPKLFTFSSLHSLFKSMQNQLPRKDRDRLIQWENQEVFLAESIGERDRFLEVLEHRIVGERLSLFFKNHLEKLGVVVAGMKHWITVGLEILSGDLVHAAQVMEKIRQHEDKFKRVQSLIADTMSGGVQKMTLELKPDVDRFFSDRPGTVVDSALAFIRHYQVDFKDYEDKLDASGFNLTMYKLFQDFKGRYDRFMAESITPSIIKYIKDKENRIGEFMGSIFSPYEAMVVDVLNEYQNAVGKIGISIDFGDQRHRSELNMEMIKQVIGLKLPPSDSAMRFSAKIRTDAVIRLGFYSVVKMIKKLFKKPLQNPKEEFLLALKDGLNRIKRETGLYTLYHFKNYRENIKFQYLLKLVQGTANYFIDEIGHRFQSYVADLSQLSTLIDRKETPKEETIRVLNEMNEISSVILMRIDRARILLGSRQSSEGLGG